MEKKSMGAFLAALRKASGMTQKQLADRLNVSDKAVSRWERDENAPDLSLIPVIAEIFGITSDELLRGERAAPGEAPERTTAKVEKQVRRILNETLTTYHIQCAISVTVAVVSLIAAMIGNLGFLRARIGFLCGCVFFVLSLLCQTIWGILARNRTSELPEAKEAGCLIGKPGSTEPGTLYSLFSQPNINRNTHPTAIPIFTAIAIYRPACDSPVDCHRQKKAPTFRSRLYVCVTWFHCQGSYRPAVRKCPVDTCRQIFHK